MKPGIYKDMSNKDYHAAKGISCSGLKQFLKSGKHYKHYLENKEDKPEFSLGTAFHTAVLEPDKYSDNIAVAPKCDRRTKIGKATWEEFQEASEGKTVITMAQGESVEAMSSAAMECETTKELLSKGDPEVSIFFEYNGLLCKTRPDWHFYKEEDHVVVVDLKSTKDASPQGFPKEIARYGYHVQDWFYRLAFKQLGVRFVDFIFIAVDSSAPHCVSFRQLNEEGRIKGELDGKRAFDEYKKSLDTGIYLGYPDMVLECKLPSWA